jgi:surface protein
MFEEEKCEKRIEKNHDISKIIQLSNDKEKNEPDDNADNIFDKINDEKYEFKNPDINSIDKHHHSKKISLDDINRISNSICIISISTSEGKFTGTCFFMNIMKKKFLISNNHILTNKSILNQKHITIINNFGEEFRILLHHKKKIIQIINKPYDITAVEILEDDKIKNITFLDYDYNDMNKYINEEVFILQHPNGKELHIASGTIININKKIYEFEHTLDTDNGSAGSPVIRTDNCKVIGIHKKRIEESDNKKGSFINLIVQKIINKLNKFSPPLDFNKINYTNEINNNNENELEENNVIILKYLLNREEPIILFSKSFLNKNKKGFNIFIDGKKYQLEEKSILRELINKKKNQNQKLLEIKVKFNKPITNMCEIFYQCNLLKSVRFIKFNTSNLVIMEKSFALCKNLTEIYGIDEFDTSNLVDISGLFSGCISLINLPNYLNWDTSKVTKMSEVFSNCKSLTTIPDISTWKTSNVLFMHKLFENCNSLITIPDIKNWDTSNVKNMSYMFHNCIKLEKLPDISLWNVCHVENLNSMFSSCKSLKEIPDISKWNITNVKSMNKIFLSCNSASFLPDISKWNTKKVKKKQSLFDLSY